jgi:hypothetical protein
MYGKTLEEVRAHRAYVEYMEMVRRQAEAIRNEHDEVEEDRYWHAFLARSERYHKREEATARPPEYCAITTTIRVQAVDTPNDNDTLASQQQALAVRENSSGPATLSLDDTPAHSGGSAYTHRASRSICNLIMLDSRGALWSLMSFLIK